MQKCEAGIVHARVTQIVTLFHVSMLLEELPEHPTASPARERYHADL